MYIDWIEYQNTITGQQIERVEFLKLSLLVGKSAAGKTRILNVITEHILHVLGSRELERGTSFRMQFRVGTSAVSQCYIWKIVTSADSSLQLDSGVRIVEESLTEFGGKIIFRRNASMLSVDGYERVPQIQPNRSVLNVYQANEPFRTIYDGMATMSTTYAQNIAYQPIPRDIFKTVQETIARAKVNKQPVREMALQRLHYPLGLLLYLAQEVASAAYEEFMDDLQAIFPDIDEVSLRPSSSGDNAFYLAIRQGERWITQQDVSSGMMRTMYILATLHLRDDSTVIMIDELENSLGVNCLDEVVDRMMLATVESNVQLILTSHHPYIINNIPVGNWLVVSQNAGIVESRSAEDIGISTLDREHFFELLNYMKR